MSEEKETREIQCGDLFDSPTGWGTYATPCTLLVCSRHEDTWNCLQLRGYHRGFTEGSDDGYWLTAEVDLSKLNYVGNLYDMINAQFGEQTGTRTDQPSEPGGE